jgi:teichuronic acid biosynthesis glycosyltransferase TuaH
VRPVLLSIELWDEIWRRNQQLASRIPGTIFVEPGRPGLSPRWRREGDVDILTPTKPLPFRLPGGDAAFAALAAAEIRRFAGDEPVVTWATHPFQERLVAQLAAPLVYDRTDDWPAMESDPAAAKRAATADRRLLQRAARVVIVSEAMRSQSRPDAVLVPNGVDFGLFSSVPARPSGGPFVVGFAGTLDPFRLDLGLMQAAVAEPGVELLVVGPGSGHLRAMALGTMPPAQVAQRLLTCDALIAPYRVDQAANRTADALKLYEYFATGLPVLAAMTAGFERYPDLVVRLPLAGPIRDVCAQNLEFTEARRRVAAQADWSQRAAAVMEVLAHAGADPVRS